MSDTCRSCQALIRWALTLTGKRIPLDPEPDPERGNVVLTFGEGGRAIALAIGNVTDKVRAASRRNGVELYLSHFATCPNAREHRRRR